MNVSEHMVAQAAEALKRGDIVAFPTETVYGLGGDTFNVDAIARIYALKGRPSDNPLIAHVLDVAMAQRLSSDWNDRADQLASAFWPGPLTLVVARHQDVPREASAHLETIAVRAPKHPVARALLERFGGPVSAPSANRSGHISPTAASHVREEFPDATELLVLDGGASEVGLESTVVDVSDPAAPVRILRPGHVTEAMIRRVGVEVEHVPLMSQGISPGTRASHYAPMVPTELVDAEAFPTRVAGAPDDTALICFESTATDWPHRIVMPGEAPSYARRIYDALRRAEAMPVARILIERWSDEAAVGEPLWDTIGDRLRRACVPRDS